MRTLRALFGLVLVGITYLSFWFSSYCFSQRDELMKYVGKINDFLGKYEVPFYLPEDAWKIAYYTNQVAWVLLTFIVVSLWWNRRKARSTNEYRKSYRHLVSENERLEAEMLAMKNTIDREATSQEDEAKWLRQRVAELENQLDTDVDATMIGQFRATSEKLKQAENDSRQIRSENDALRAGIAQKETNLAILNQTRASLEQQAKELSERLARSEKALEATIQDRNQLALQVATYKAAPNNVDFSAIRKAMESAAAQITNGLSTSAASIQQSTANLGSAAEVAALRQELADAKVQIARLSSGLGPDVSKEIDQVLASLNEVVKGYNQAAQLMNAGSHSSAVRQLNGLVQHLDKTIEALRQLRNNNANPTLENAKCSARKEGELTAKNEALQQQLTDERARSDKLMSTLETLTARVDTLTRLEDSASQIGEATGEIQSLQEAIDGLRKDLEETKDLLVEVKDDRHKEFDEQQRELGGKLDRLDSRMAAILAHRNGHAHRGSRGGRHSEEVGG